MKVLNLKDIHSQVHSEIPPGAEGQTLLILAKNSDVPALSDVFHLDEDTVVDCTDLDESIRFSSFPGYDFISLILPLEEMTREVNIYVSLSYLLIVLPDSQAPWVKKVSDDLLALAFGFQGKSHPLNRLYYHFLDQVLSEFSRNLEALEDKVQDLSESISAGVKPEQMEQIDALKREGYAAKKLLRASSYLGSQILIDENHLIQKAMLPFFRTIDTRLRRLEDFADSLYLLSNELLYAYDNRLTQKTNDVINKLTIITLIFAPLTVITGVYGMNFQHMPELSKPFAYPAVLVAMLAVSIGLIWLAKKKKWM